MKKTIFLVIFLLTTLNIFPQDSPETQLLKYFHTIQSEEMMSWLQKLCSPAFNGRLSGTPEFIASAEWVAGNLKEWGITPGADNGSYFQWFNVPYTELKDCGNLSLILKQPDGSEIHKNYRYPDEYYPGMNSGSGSVTSEIVWVGYGITAPELNYDDYSGIDVKGKIVMMNRDVPYSDPYNAEYKKWVSYCYHQYKLENAVKHGAAGMLYIDGAMANPNISYDPSIVICGIGSQPLDDVFAGLKTTNKVLLDKIKKSFRPASFPTGKVMTISASTVRHPEGKACNVIGLLPGNDSVLKNDVIIIGGHLDAVGNAGQVVNGALDNGSGVIDIMATAKALAVSGIKLKRSVLFIFIGGEESGLLGSKAYTEKPSFEKDKTVTYINLDMVGNGTGLSMSAGSPYKEFLKYFEDANKMYIHRSMQTAAPEVGSYYGRPRTDGVVFSSAGYRTMDVGTTEWYKKVYYHIPGDDPEAVSIDIMEDVSKMLYVGLINMANDTELKY